jgi:hypothetical protein
VNQNRLAVRFQRALARALVAPDPVAATRRIARDRRHPAALRRALHQADGAGVEMAALLVARLRFERLVRGSPDAEAWFEADAAGFAAAFRRYHGQVPPVAFFPAEEARAFHDWRERKAGTRGAHTAHLRP